MENEEQTKKEWLKPEIIDMDLNKTAGGFSIMAFESTASGPPGTMS